ncbi:MAG: Protein GlcG, partial [uncultured Ramlibacter sp.]
EKQRCPRTGRCQGHRRRGRSRGPQEPVGGVDRHRRRRRPPPVAATPGRRRARLGAHRARQGQHGRPRSPREPRLRGDDQWRPGVVPERARDQGPARGRRAHPQGRPVPGRRRRQRRQVERGRAGRPGRHRRVGPV